MRTPQLTITSPKPKAHSPKKAAFVLIIEDKGRGSECMEIKHLAMSLKNGILMTLQSIDL